MNIQIQTNRHVQTDTLTKHWLINDSQMNRQPYQQGNTQKDRGERHTERQTNRHVCLDDFIYVLEGCCRQPL